MVHYVMNLEFDVDNDSYHSNYGGSTEFNFEKPTICT